MISTPCWLRHRLFNSCRVSALPGSRDLDRNSDPHGSREAFDDSPCGVSPRAVGRRAWHPPSRCRDRFRTSSKGTGLDPPTPWRGQLSSVVLPNSGLSTAHAPRVQPPSATSVAQCNGDDADVASLFASLLVLPSLDFGLRCCLGIRLCLRPLLLTRRIRLPTKGSSHCVPWTHTVRDHAGADSDVSHLVFGLLDELCDWVKLRGRPGRECEWSCERGRACASVHCGACTAARSILVLHLDAASSSWMCNLSRRRNRFAKWR